MTYRQQNLIPHGSGGWEVQSQDVSIFRVWLSPASWFIEGPLLAVSLHETSLRFLAKDTNLIYTLKLGIRFPYMNFAET